MRRAHPKTGDKLPPLAVTHANFAAEPHRDCVWITVGPHDEALIKVPCRGCPPGGSSTPSIEDEPRDDRSRSGRSRNSLPRARRFIVMGASERLPMHPLFFRRSTIIGADVEKNVPLAVAPGGRPRRVTRPHVR
jgi:hypothetical protein